MSPPELVVPVLQGMHYVRDVRLDFVILDLLFLLVQWSLQL